MRGNILPVFDTQSNNLPLWRYGGALDASQWKACIVFWGVLPSNLKLNYFYIRSAITSIENKYGFMKFKNNCILFLEGRQIWGNGTEWLTDFVESAGNVNNTQFQNYGDTLGAQISAKKVWVQLVSLFVLWINWFRDIRHNKSRSDPFNSNKKEFQWFLYYLITNQLKSIYFI